jgi:hypothetical protein
MTFNGICAITPWKFHDYALLYLGIHEGINDFEDRVQINRTLSEIGTKFAESQNSA